MDVTLGILDIKEKEIDDIAPPIRPTVNGSSRGFPAGKKRVSAFKKQQSQGKPTAASPAPTSSITPSNRPSSQNDVPKRDAKFDERRGIDEENKAVLGSMSPDEIAQAQREILDGTNPKILQMLLRRANLDEPTGPSPFDVPSPESQPAPNAPSPQITESRQVTIEDAPKSPPAPKSPLSHTTKPRQVTVEDALEEPHETEPNPAPLSSSKVKSKLKLPDDFDEDDEPPVPPPDLFPVKSIARPQRTAPKPTPTTTLSADVPHNTHFPPAPAVPDLDPSDPDFLATMHQKFFPNLPADPSKLAWMAPLPTPDSAADRDSPYYPGQSALPVSALRFDFRGALVPPRKSRTIPVSKGLHHHGEAPEAAGYTVPELARLARSSVASQRCLAYQTLGRMLYRLGRGDWGRGVGGRGGEEDDLAFGLWRCFKEGRVLQSLEEEASLPEWKGHMSSKAYATEALWLFEKGGWKEKWRGM